MAMKAKHAFGSEKNLQSALSSGKIDAYDILFLDEKKVGWVNKNGEIIIAEPDLSGIEENISQVESELATKADAEEVEEKIALKANISYVEEELSAKADVVEVEEKIKKITTDTIASAKAYTDGKVEAAVKEHLVKKFEISNVPDGTLIDYRDDEIRIMCRENAVFSEQSVGVGGDPKCYYTTLKTYVFDDNVVGYKEHLNGQVDNEILTDLKTDEYGRRYQPTWLSLARLGDDGNWSYYGKSSSEEKFIGFDYQIDFYDANGVMIGSDTVRINLSNEGCHFINEPYYVGKIRKEVDAKIEEKIAEVEASYEVVEF